MIVLDDTPVITSKVPPVTSASSQPPKWQQPHLQNALRSDTALEPSDVPARVKLAAVAVVSRNSANVDSRNSANDDSGVASSKSVNTPASNKTTMAGRRIVAASSLIALASVTLMNIYWNTHDLDGISQRLANIISTAQSAERQQPLTETTSELSLPPVPNPPIANSAIDGLSEQTDTNSTVKELNETRQLANGYLDEITWLQSQMSMLQQKNNNLNNETTDLNRELLQLEMKVTALQANTKQ